MFNAWGQKKKELKANNVPGKRVREEKERDIKSNLLIGPLISLSIVAREEIKRTNKFIMGD